MYIEQTKKYPVKLDRCREALIVLAHVSGTDCKIGRGSSLGCIGCVMGGVGDGWGWRGGGRERNHDWRASNAGVECGWARTIKVDAWGLISGSLVHNECQRKPSRVWSWPRLLTFEGSAESTELARRITGRASLAECGRTYDIEYTDAGRDPPYSENDSRRGMFVTVVKMAKCSQCGPSLHGTSARLQCTVGEMWLGSRVGKGKVGTGGQWQGKPRPTHNSSRVCWTRPISGIPLVLSPGKVF
jgi:hypothetical protein